jgi:hypothetical protein
MLRRLQTRVLNRWRIITRAGLLTIHNHAHIPDETVDDLKSLSRGSPSHILCESVQSVQDRLNILLSEVFLYKSYCITLRRVVSCRQK